MKTDCSPYDINDNFLEANVADVPSTWFMRRYHTLTLSPDFWRCWWGWSIYRPTDIFSRFWLNADKSISASVSTDYKLLRTFEWFPSDPAGQTLCQCTTEQRLDSVKTAPADETVKDMKGQIGKRFELHLLTVIGIQSLKIVTISYLFISTKWVTLFPNHTPVAK